VAKKVRKIYIDQKERLEVHKQLLLNQNLAIERKRNIVEEKLLDGIISDEDFVRMKQKLEQKRALIQNQLDEIKSERNYDMEVLEEVLNSPETFIMPIRRLHTNLRGSIYPYFGRNS